MIVWLLGSSISAQKIWTVKSEDGLVKAKNYIGLSEGRDSAIVETPAHKFKFSYHYSRDSSEIDDEVDNAITINDIKKINKEVYLILATGGNLPMNVQLNLIFISKNKIIKHFVVYSLDRALNGVTFKTKVNLGRNFDYYYDEKNNEFIFPRTLQGIYDRIPIYEVNLQTNKLDCIMPINIDVEKYSRKMPPIWRSIRETHYYKIKL